VTGLLDMGAKVRAFDPVGMEQARHELPNTEYCEETPVLEPIEARLCCVVGRAVVLGAART
jgi:UDP-glucose 6-dehydrogenase